MFGIKKFLLGLKIVPKTSSTADAKGELEVIDSTGKLGYHNGTSVSPVVTESHSATLTNKTIDADSNTITNIENADIKAAAAIDASKLADGSVSNTEFQYISTVTSNVQDQLNSKATATGLSDHINDTVDAHDASAISVSAISGLAATEVQAALAEHQVEIENTYNDLGAHITDTIDAHDASAISSIPSGNLAATEVQAALNELQSDIDTRATTSALGAHTGATSAHGVSGAIVGTTDSQTLSSKTLTSPVLNSPSIVTPSRSDVKQDTLANLVTYAASFTPPAGNGQMVFATDTKAMYQVVDAVLVSVGSGGGVANINALLTQTFDSAILANFTQTGLALTTSNPIDGTQSARLIHQAASSQSFKQVIAVDRKYRGDLMAMSLQVRSSATSGNLTLLVTDETNSAVIMASSSISTSQYQVATAVTNATTTISGFSNVDINLLKVGMTITGAGIPTATVISSINTAANTIVISQAATASATITAKFSALPDRKTFSFVIPTNCASLSYTVTALQEAGLPESYVDDVVIELANVSLLETSVTVPNLTAWQGYTPTIQGFGTPSAIEFEWRQVGENVEIRGKFTSGTPTSVQARFSLPNGYTSAGSGIIPSIQPVGKWVRSAGTGNTQKQAVILIEPSVNYLSISLDDSTNAINPLIKQNGDVILLASETGAFFASVPCAGLSASSSVAIPLTQSGLVQEADTSINMSAGTTLAAANFLFTTTNKFIGSAISYNGATGEFTIQKSGVYTAHAHAVPAGNASPSIQLQVDGVVRSYTTIYPSTGAGGVVSFSEFLDVGQKIRLLNLNNTSSAAIITIVKEGSLKQVSVNTNSKITIPTSELRFEGASSRGSTDTFIIKFDTQAKIRGDAFTVTNNATNGTYVTMTKAGLLSVSSTLYFTSTAFMSITKNQAVLNVTPAASEILSGEFSTGTNDTYNPSWTGFVNVGDVIRVALSSPVNPTANASNILNLSFQEQEIQVSVSNTLPQFSESDSCVRLSGANGFGSSATTTRRFASTIQNIGTDIEYIDSATLGGQFIAKASGIYNVSYTEESSANVTETTAQIMLNGSTYLAYDNQQLNTASVVLKQATASWSGYLTVGDVISAKVSSPSGNTGSDTRFTISKVGKPNVTGVNVTPFVNVPQPVSQHSFMDITQTVGTSATVTGALNRNTANGIFSYNSSTGVYTALKTGNYTISAMLQVGVTQVQATIFLDGVDVARQFENGAVTGGASCSYAGIISAGSTFYVSNSSGAGSSSRQVVSVLATAASDTILTAPETFSTDTAALTWAPDTQYTLSTLANAPVGTFITFRYAANTNTRTQTTVLQAPAQTTANMNANGILIYTRAYNAASTDAQPAAIAIQIGKGLKGISRNLYKSTGKVTAGNLDFWVAGTTDDIGVKYNTYNESTGILYIDAGNISQTTTVSHAFLFEDITSQTSGYLVVNASKNPALTGLGIDRVAARAVQTSGQSIPNNTATVVTWDATKTFDTHNALNSATGVFTCPVSGYYKVDAGVLYTSVAWAATSGVELNIYKNGNVTTNTRTVTQAITTNFGVTVSDTIYLNKGDTVSIATYQPRGSATTLFASSGIHNYFSIAKISGIN